MTKRLHHWDTPNRNEFLDLAVDDTNSVALDVSVENDGAENGLGRFVRLEVRDNGTLGVLCYSRDRDDPIIVELNADGTWKVDTND